MTRNNQQKSRPGVIQSDSDDDDASGRQSDNEDANTFEVEHILDKRDYEGMVQYLIHWKGFDESHDTWEPVECLDGCPGILKRFEEKLARGKSRSNSPVPGPSSRSGSRNRSSIARVTPANRPRPTPKSNGKVKQETEETDDLVNDSGKRKLGRPTRSSRRADTSTVSGYESDGSLKENIPEAPDSPEYTVVGQQTPCSTEDALLAHGNVVEVMEVAAAKDKTLMCLLKTDQSADPIVATFSVTRIIAPSVLISFLESRLLFAK